MFWTSYYESVLVPLEKEDLPLQLWVVFRFVYGIVISFISALRCVQLVVQIYIKVKGYTV